MNEQSSTLNYCTLNIPRKLTLLCLSGIITFAFGCQSSEQTTAQPSHSDSITPKYVLPEMASLTAPDPSKPKYVRPKRADNGVPFPKKSGYVKKYPIRFTNGYSDVTVDNSQNKSDVFVKIYALDSKPKQIIRVFFIRAGESFTAKNIRVGNYDVRYRDLDSGALSRTQQFNLQEIRSKNQIKFSQIRLTLYQVAGGNMQTFDISEQEF